MVRNIVFDMGMVLMDYHPLAASRAIAPDEEGAQKIFEALFRCPEWAMTDEGTLSLEGLVPVAVANLTDPALQALIPPLVAGMPWNVLSPIEAMRGVPGRLRDRGFGVYLLSNASEMVSKHLDIVPDITRFSGVVISCVEKLVKPDPAIYRLLTDRYGLSPSECLFVDDIQKNVEGAVAEGWHGYVHDGDADKLVRFLAALPNP